MLYFNNDNGCMDYESMKYTQYDVCAAFYGTKVLRQLDQVDTPNELFIAVNDHHKESWSFTVPVTVLNDQNTLVSTLLANKLPINHFMSHALSTYLTHCYRDCLNNNRIEYVHNQLGWFEHNQKHYFLYDKTQVDSFVSTSQRKDFKFSGGSKDKYLDFLKDVVYPVPTLALAMAISYSSVVVSRLKEYYDFGTIIVNLCGASSTGKTTVEHLMVSPFACPTISNKTGLIHTFNATSNATFSGIDGIHGLPIVLDDVTTNPNVNLPNLIYTLASGEQKGRCNADGSLRSDNSGWSGIVIISSETPIHEQTVQNQGLKVRVLHTEGITWTPNAETAQKIKRTVLHNYGYTGKEFAEYVASTPIEDLCEQFDQAEAKVKTIMQKRDKLSDRLQTKYSAFYLTITLMNKCFELSLDPDELMTIFIEPEQNSVEERNLAQKGKTAIINFVTRKYNSFIETYDKSKTDVMAAGYKDYAGVIRHLKGSCDVFIHTDVVNKILKEAGITEPLEVKRGWKEMGFTHCEKDRYDVKYLEHRRYFQFIFPKDFSPLPEECSDIRNRHAIQNYFMQQTPIYTDTYDDSEQIAAFLDGSLC